MNRSLRLLQGTSNNGGGKGEAEVVQLAQAIAKEDKKEADAVATKEEAASVSYAVGVVDKA